MIGSSQEMGTKAKEQLHVTFPGNYLEQDRRINHLPKQDLRVYGKILMTFLVLKAHALVGSLYSLLGTACAGYRGSR